MSSQDDAAIRAMIREAVAAENKRCAKICYDRTNFGNDTALPDGTPVPATEAMKAYAGAAFDLGRAIEQSEPAPARLPWDKP